MARRLPPLNALKAMEAAGRHMSITRAADELHVTPGAISRQIKVLEDFLHVAVFGRSNHELRLAPEAKVFVQALTETFDHLARSTQRFLHGRNAHPLHIHCSMTFTLRWLLPRLTSFHASHPMREIRLTTTLVPITSLLGAGDDDVMIDLGDGNWPGLVSHRLADSELVPVCRPRMATALRRARCLEELGNHTLLHSLARPVDWASWLRAAGATSVDPNRGFRFESSSLAYQAAIEGMGVAIAQKCLIQDDLRARRLTTPFSFTYKDGWGYYMVYLPRSAEEPRLVEFRDWILRSAGCVASPE